MDNKKAALIFLSIMFAAFFIELYLLINEIFKALGLNLISF